MTEQGPQYGEYATPEEQRLRAGLPPVQEAAAPVAEPAVETAAEARPRSWDRIITIALLAYGVVNVFMSGAAYLDLPTAMNDTMRILGIEGEFTNFAQGRLWGTIAAVLLVIGWVITALISVRRMRKSKHAWWIPLVGAVATMFVVSLCLTVPMLGDPAFIAYVSGSSGS